jgi:cytosine/creatinine deaminase
MRIINARLRGGTDLVDIQLDGEKIASVIPVGVGEERTVRADDYDAAGRLVVPQFAEAHIHLDYANTEGVPRINESGTLFEAIGIWADRKRLGLHNKVDIKAKALEAVRQAVGHGVGFIRTHVDVTDPGFAGFEALAELRDEVRDWCDIQIVAFPQNGVFAYEGGARLVAEAMAAGADVVGGIPHLEPTREDGVSSLKLLFDLAEKYSAPIDVHTDEIDDPHSRFVEVVAAEAAKRSMGEQTVVSHSVAMAYYSPGYMARLLPKLAASRVRFAVCPNENLHLQGLGFQGPVPRGVAPVKALTEWGIPVSFCQDSLNDPFYPMGDGDLLRILDSGLHVSHMLTPDHLPRALDFITTHPAGNLGLTDYGVVEGNRADLLVLDAKEDKEAVQRKSAVLLSVHRGRTVLRREAVRTHWEV